MIKKDVISLMTVMITKNGKIQAEIPNPNDQNLIKEDVDSLMTVMITKDEIIQAEVPNLNNQDLMIVI